MSGAALQVALQLLVFRLNRGSAESGNQKSLLSSVFRRDVLTGMRECIRKLAAIASYFQKIQLQTGVCYLRGADIRVLQDRILKRILRHIFGNQLFQTEACRVLSLSYSKLFSSKSVKGLYKPFLRMLFLRVNILTVILVKRIMPEANCRCLLNITQMLHGLSSYSTFSRRVCIIVCNKTSQQ